MKTKLNLSARVKYDASYVCSMVFLLLLPLQSLAQAVVITGIVQEQENKEPLPYTNI